jgi:hypothetical protein
MIYNNTSMFKFLKLLGGIYEVEGVFQL